MSQPDGTSANGESALLHEILSSLKAIQQENSQLAAAVDAINGRVNILAGVKQMQDGTAVDAHQDTKPIEDQTAKVSNGSDTPSVDVPVAPADTGRRSSTTSKIILTSYPGQAGIDPLPMSWGHKDPNVRGPVVVSRNTSTIRRRNGEPK